MFYTILPESPPVFAVQPNETPDAQSAAELIGRLERHFMHAIAIVTWDKDGKYQSYGYPVSEEIASSEDLQWREFELPPEEEVPF
jgi:hypothetical protein